MEYTGTHQEQQEQYRQAMEKYIAERNQAMAEAGISFGDTVEYHAVGLWHHVEIRTGVVYETRRGQPRVKVGKKSYPWHKGYRKIN